MVMSKIVADKRDSWNASQTHRVWLAPLFEKTLGLNIKPVYAVFQNNPDVLKVKDKIQTQKCTFGPNSDIP
jgi:hypothetical protein